MEGKQKIEGESGRDSLVMINEIEGGEDETLTNEGGTRKEKKAEASLVLATFRLLCLIGAFLIALLHSTSGLSMGANAPLHLMIASSSKVQTFFQAFLTVFQ